MISGFELMKSRGVKNALAMVVDGELMDLSALIDEKSHIEFVTKDHVQALDLLRHTTAHIMAQAIKELWPNTQFAIGPVIENGFYYDIMSDHQITPDDFPIIEKKMKEIIKADLKISRESISKEEALKMFSEMNEPFKIELIQDLDVAEVTVYRHEDKFLDLCRGPHLPKTGVASNHFKIMKIAGAYWRGDSKREMLQRIYATAWFSKDDLDQYLHNIEEAEKRDHRKIAREMDLFHIQEESPGCIFWHPKGWRVYNILKDYMRQRLEKDGYQEVCTPQLVDRSLWIASGHWDKYRENMFIAESEGRTLAIKPMNCPGAIQIFKQGVKSYKMLPLRLAEFGYCHRNEPSGSLYGAMRVRGFTQDDAHIFCTPDQLNSETKRFCNLLTKVYRDLGFESFSVKFSDRPEKRTGSDEVWDEAEKRLKEATEEAGLSYTLNKGEGAFYGPKLEFVLKDKLGRDWQCGTLQVDFQLPEKLGAYYTAQDGNRYHPIMVHRAVLGSFERFIGIMLENYAGRLPLWLAPVHVTIATVSQEHNDYAVKIDQALQNIGVRTELDIGAHKISQKILEHIMKKTPIILIIGAKEKNDGTVTARYTDSQQRTMPLDEFVKQMQDDVKMPKID